MKTLKDMDETTLNIANTIFSPRIEITDNGFFTLSIENKQFLYSFITELRRQCDGNEGSYVLSYGNKVLSFEKNVELISDLTDINFNSKNITNLVGKKFAEFMGEGEQGESLSTIEAIICKLADAFESRSNLNIEYDSSITAAGLAKLCNLHIADTGKTLAERLCDYVSLLSELKPLKLFVVVFAKSFLSDESIDYLWKYCQDCGVRLLLVEGHDGTEPKNDERRLIIDNDLCCIPIHFGIQ